MLYNYIDRHARTSNKTKTKNTKRLNYNSLCYIASRNGWVTTKGIYIVTAVEYVPSIISSTHISSIYGRVDCSTLCA